MFSFHKLTTNQFQEMLKALRLFKDRAVNRKKKKSKTRQTAHEWEPNTLRHFGITPDKQLWERLRA